MPQNTFRNAFKLLKAKQHKWKRSLRKKLAFLKTKSNSKLHIRNLDTIIPKPEGYPIPTIRATRRFPIDDFSDSDSDSEEEEEEDLAAESSSSPDDGSTSSNESSSSEVYDVPSSCQNSLFSASTLAPEIETETETDHGNVSVSEMASTSDRFSSFRKSTCTASTRDSYVTAASYLDSDSAGDKHEDEDEDDPGPGPGPNGDESIRSDTSATSYFESQDSQSDTSTSSTLASSISC